MAGLSYRSMRRELRDMGAVHALVGVGLGAGLGFAIFSMVAWVVVVWRMV